MIPPGKYNRFCERRPLVCSDEKRIDQAYTNSLRKELTSSEQAILFLHDLVGCEGIEFVAFSNARLDEPVILPENVKLVPCFIPDTDGKSINDPLVILTMKMEKRSRFIYDGWLPISEWDIVSIRTAIRKIDQALSIFSLQGRVSFSWEPKYKPGITNMSMLSSGDTYQFEHQHIQSIEKLSHYTGSLDAVDSAALFRSIAWLSQSLRLKEPAARFLFCVLAIESLATYIEEEAADNSVFAPLKCSQLNSSQRKSQREECIKNTLNDYLNKNPEKAIKSAYFDCIMGIKRRLKMHLEKVFVEDLESVNLLFNTKVEGKTLYDLRHTIAHGTMDALSEAQREMIYNRAQDAERLTRRYILKVLELVMGKSVFVNQINLHLIFSPESLTISSERKYSGPTHMAEIYIDS